MTNSRLVLACSGALFISACVHGDDGQVGSVSGSVSDGTAAAAGVLGFLNGPDASLEVLDYEIGLDRRAATSIFDYTRGPDRVYGSADDARLHSIADLDALYWVGDSAIAKILAHVESIGGIPEIQVEGVFLTAEQASSVVALANSASIAELDHECELDSRAARNIVERRPFGDVFAVAEVAYVGPSALRKLRDFAGEWGPQDPDELDARVRAILANHGITGARLDFPADEVAAQAEMFGDAVTFDEALDAAVESFLTDADDAESPLEIVLNVGPYPPCEQPDLHDRLQCNLNLSTTLLAIVGHEWDREEDDFYPAENGEQPADAWIFFLYVPSIGDHLHWAIVDRTRDSSGEIVVYNYGFN